MSNLDSLVTTVTELDPVIVDDDGGDDDNTITIRTFALQLRECTVHVCSLGASVLHFYYYHRTTTTTHHQDDDDDNGDESSLVDIVCGYETAEEMYSSQNPYYFHACVGRVANRIAKGTFTLQGKQFQVPPPPNNGSNALHGGPRGFSHCNWDANTNVLQDGVEFTLLSADGDQGFPGNVQVKATYRLLPTLSTTGVALQLQMEATLLDDETPATPINMAHHSYFNLMGTHGNGILDHTLQVDADAYTPVDGEGIPTKLVQPLDDDDPAMDFRQPRILKEAIHEFGMQKMGLTKEQCDQHTSSDRKRHLLPIFEPYGFDHNYVVRKQPGMALPRVAQLSAAHTTTSSSSSSSSLTIYSSAPGVQIYTANFLDTNEDDDDCRGTTKTPYQRWDAVCLETQHFPDSIRDDDDDDIDDIDDDDSVLRSATHSSFWEGKCPILTPSQPNYHHLVVYQLESSPFWQTAYRGSNTEGKQYDSIEAMWADQDLSNWYGRAKDWYEDNCDATVDGVLGGIGYVSDQDLKGSRAFLQQKLDVPCNDNSTIKWSCEMGAGIGRVTKGLLLDVVDRCDLVESSSRLLLAAPDYIGSRADRCRFFCQELQDWTPNNNNNKYSIIWIQWVLCYLTDKDIVEFLRKCSESLVENGWIVLKENTCEDEAFIVDVEDASITRSLPYWMDLVSKSGLYVRHIQFQDDFPDDIFPVPMLALQRSSKQ
jgi:galactose mutarotase-like enzyme